MRNVQILHRQDCTVGHCRPVQSAFADLHGHRHVDIVVLPRPSIMEEGKAAVSAPSKKSELYLKLVVAVAILAAPKGDAL